MQASAYQMMRSEIKQLEHANREQQKIIEQQAQGIQQLVAQLNHVNAQLLGERTTVKILVLFNGGRVTVGKTLIQELGDRPYAYDAAVSRDDENGTQTITVTKKSDEAIAAIEAQLKARQEAIEKAQREAQAQQAAGESIVAPDGRPARESAGKLVVVH